MKIRLKNVSYSERLSQETSHYAASLYVDGKKIGEVSNDGHGGPDMFHGDHKAFASAEAWVKANMPPLECSGGTALDMDLELLCGQLLIEWLTNRDLRTSLRSKILYIPANQQGIFTLTPKGVRKIEDRHVAAARQKYPGATILNALPFEEALAFYKRYA